MSLTNIDPEGRGADRPGALRDLRFAGTVAAGLVAGVLGVGALSAPLLGWTSLSDELKSGPQPGDVRMAPGEPSVASVGRAHRAPGRSGTGAVTIPGPGGSTIVLPGSTGGGGAGGVWCARTACRTASVSRIRASRGRRILRSMGDLFFGSEPGA
jgi:hypothetical protein